MQTSAAGQKRAEVRWQEFKLGETEDVELFKAWLAQCGCQVPLLSIVTRKRIDALNKRRRLLAAGWSAAKAEESVAAAEQSKAQPS
jgi:hypothetical protein